MPEKRNSASDLFTISFGMAVTSPTASSVRGEAEWKDVAPFEEILRSGSSRLAEGASRGEEGLGWKSLPWKNI